MPTDVLHASFLGMPKQMGMEQPLGSHRAVIADVQQMTSDAMTCH